MRLAGTNGHEKVPDMKQLLYPQILIGNTIESVQTLLYSPYEDEG